MKTDVTLKVLKAINRLDGRLYATKSLSVFLHSEDTCGEYWGVSSDEDICFIVSRHDKEYHAYECKDRTHVKYMAMKMAF